jgi:hypothetical protein
MTISFTLFGYRVFYFRLFLTPGEGKVEFLSHRAPIAQPYSEKHLDCPQDSVE